MAWWLYLIHIAAYVETAFIGSSVNHRMNEPAIVMEGEDDGRVLVKSASKDMLSIPCG